MRTLLAAAFLVVLAAILAGCGGSSGSSGSNGSDDETVIASRQVEKQVQLTTEDDQTLYTFSGGNCEGQCADVWKPMPAVGHVVAEKDSGLDPALLGKQERSDGVVQVTYDGDALYTYSKEEPSQVTGVGSSFGGMWRVATANSLQRQTTTGVSCEPNCSY
jgi:predicted lipoprotein with Yx(FWY)xxD motif